MPFTLLYKPLIEREERVSKSNLFPRNIYRISSYEYKDGKTKSLAGIKSSLVFLVGIFEKKLICLKISEVKPDKFFQWLKTIEQTGLTNEDFDKAEKLEDLLILDNRAGSKIFEGYIKNKPIYNLKPSPYRTYNLDGIKYIQQVHIKKDILKSFYF